MHTQITFSARIIPLVNELLSMAIFVFCTCQCHCSLLTCGVVPVSGQEREASDEQKREMYARLSVLNTMVRPYVQRFGDEILTKELPPKREHMLLLRLNPLQRCLYEVFLAVSHCYTIPAAVIREPSSALPYLTAVVNLACLQPTVVGGQCGGHILWEGHVCN